MTWKKTSITSRQVWLDKLGKRLVWYFPALQVREILSDYREQFETGLDRGRTETELIEAMGPPEETVRQLLDEEPAAKMNRLRTSGVWSAAVVALGLALPWIVFANPLPWFGSCAFLAAFSTVLFLLLRGPARMELERDFPFERTASPLPVYCAPFILTLVFEVSEQILVVLSMAGRLPEDAGGIFMGELNTWFVLCTETLLALLAAWLLMRSVTAAIGYFPGVIHTIGAGGTVFFTYIYSQSAIILDKLSPSRNLLPLLPYFTGLAIARIFQNWVDGKRPLPYLFQPGAVTRRDWFHTLGVHLLGWFSTEQTIEILDDYQEQFELGLERGKSEEKLITELGRPETVVRDLLAEDRKARLCRRKQWPWVITAVFAGWLLLGEVSAFELGCTGLNWLLYFHPGPHKAAIVSLILGTVSLFVLLRVRDRAAVERRFPSRCAPTVWIFLIPALLCALTMGYDIYLIYGAFYWPEGHMILGIPAVWYAITLIEASILVLLFLLLWTLARGFSSSIRYFPAAIHIAGSLATILCGGMFLSAMDIELINTRETILNFLPAFLPCLVGGLLALTVWIVVRPAGKHRKEG